MASRQRLVTTRREWQADEAARAGDPGFRAIAQPGPQALPGDETYLGNETRVIGGDITMVAGLVGGGHVVVYRWGNFSTNIGVRAFDASGNLLWNKDVLPPTPNTNLSFPVVAGLADGGVMVAFQSTTIGGNSDIVTQRFDASGEPVGSLVTVTLAAGNQNWPSITALEGGGFVLVWGTSTNDDTDEIRGQIYNAAGAAVGGNFQLNAPNMILEGRPVIDALPGGGFVAVWITNDSLTAPNLIRAQRFDAAGQRVGPEMLVGQTNAEQIDVSALSDGGFVVGWSIDNDNYGSTQGTGGQVYARRFGADGTPAPEGRITVIETNTGHIGHYAFGGAVTVEGLDTGYFLINWVDSRPAVSTVYGRVYNAVGQSPSGLFIANQTTTHDHYLMNGAAALVANDTVVLAWEAVPDSGPGADNLNVFFRRIGIEVPNAIMGTPGPDSLTGTANSDLIYGLASDDALNGGLGADRMEGGLGNDTYIVDNAGDQVMEAAGAGTDTVYASLSYVLGAGAEVEVLSSQNHSGTAAINLTGNGFAQTLVGNAGANLLNGLEGIDSMAGLGGDDTYVVDRIEDQVLEAVGGGNDIVFTNVSYVLSSLQEIETLTTQTHAGTANLFLTGNQLNNVLVGNAGNNIMNGVAGADVMYGLGGDDTYAIDNAGDLVIDLENQGNDLVYTYLSHTLSNGNQIETLSTVVQQATDAINLGGNDYDNILIGNFGANYINGNGGVDVMYGLNGDDTYVVENAADQVIEGAGGGSDTLFSFVSYTLAAGQQVEAMSTAGQGATTAINLTGNEIGQIVVGNAGSNVLDGKGGSDTLHGLGGADFFAFTTALGAGNVDTLADFSVADDTIQLDDAIFAQLGALGALNASAFVAGPAAADADDRIVYNSATGALLYDADGTGGIAAVQFATLATGLALTASDFAVI